MIRSLAGRAHLWAAREIRTGEVMAVQASRGRGIGECIRFLERLGESCINKPILYTDRGHGTNGPPGS